MCPGRSPPAMAALGVKASPQAGVQCFLPAQAPYLSLRGVSTVGCPLGRVWWEGGETLGGGERVAVVACPVVQPLLLCCPPAGCPGAPRPSTAGAGPWGTQLLQGREGRRWGPRNTGRPPCCSWLLGALGGKRGQWGWGWAGWGLGTHLAGGSAGALRLGWAAG